MSMPIIETPNNPINREQSISNLIESVALMETGLSHVINAEGEKIQKVVDPDADYSLEDIINVNDSAEKLVNTVAKLEMILQSKLEISKDLDSNQTPGPPGTPGVTETVYALGAQNLDKIYLDFVTTPIIDIAFENISYINGFTVNPTNTEFTVQNSGSYLVIYSIYTTVSAGSIFHVGIAINNVINPSTFSSITLSNDFSNNTSNSIINLNAGDVIKLNVHNIATTREIATKARLTITKIA